MICSLARSSLGSWGPLCLPSASPLGPAVRRTYRSGRPSGRPAGLGTRNGWWWRGQSVFLRGCCLQWMVLCNFSCVRGRPCTSIARLHVMSHLKHPLKIYFALRKPCTCYGKSEIPYLHSSESALWGQLKKVCTQSLPLALRKLVLFRNVVFHENVFRFHL